MLRRGGMRACTLLRVASTPQAVAAGKGAVLLARPSAAVLSFRSFASSSEFEDAKNRLGTLEEDPGPDTKLKLYGLFKQATTGPCNAKKPGMLDMIAKAKWNAWNTLGDMSKEDAEKEYIKLVNSLAKDSGSNSAKSGPSGSSEKQSGGDPSGNYKEILYEERDKITYITLNRPSKFNAITTVMYGELTEALEVAGKNDTYATVITGAGKYFCAGNDLSNLTKMKGGSIGEMAAAGGEMLEKFVSAFIDHPKVLVGLINGPCIGISCTTLGLYDMVYASDSAFFHTPFTSLGLTPEGCSTYTFPRRLGPMKANEMLLLGRKLSAAEALESGFITDVFPASNFEQEARQKVQDITKFLPISLKESKIFIRKFERDILHQVNHEESQMLVKMWQGEESLQAAMKFLNKSKSK